MEAVVQRALRRRRILSGAGVLGGAAVLAACGPVGGSNEAAKNKGPVTVKLAMWDYRPDTVRSNLDQFQNEF